MVGTLQKGKAIYALVRTPEKDVYQVRAGNYMGQNFGVITGITDSEIRLKELVQDSAGDWTERSSTLQLHPGRREDTGAKKMSAFVWLDSVAPRARGRRRAARGSLAALAALARRGRGVRAGDQQHRCADGRRRAPPGSTIVKFTLKAPPANPPAGFAIASPPRIALDFLDTANGLGANAAHDRRRRRCAASTSSRPATARAWCFNLNRPQTFSTAGRGQRGPGHAVRPERAARRQGADGAALRRGASRRRRSTRCATSTSAAARNGEGRIIVDLSDNSTGIDIRQQGKTLIVDFLKTVAAAQPRAPPRRRRTSARRCVTVDTFDAGRQRADGRSSRKGLWEHSAYQTDNRFILEVKPVQEDPNKLMQGSRQGYKGEKLSLNFQNVEVRAVLQVIADFTGLNIITSDTVQGNLTLRLKDMPWDQALDIIMQTKGLDMRKNGNVVLIAPREELALKEKQQLEAQAQISDLEPLRLGVVPAQLHEGAATSLNLLIDQPAAAVRRGRRADGDDRRPGLDPVQARRRDGRSAHEHPVRAGHRRRASRRCARSSASSTRRSARC